MTRLFIKPATNGLHHHSYDPSTITSMDLGELSPCRIIETLPGDHFTKIAGSGLVRLAPQVFPAFGKAYIKSAGFFVPEHQLIEYSEAFHSNMSTYKGEVIELPHFFSHESINALFAGYSSLRTVVTSITSPNNPDLNFPSPDTYDFVYCSESGTNVPVFGFYKLTRLGQRFYKILKLLGYDFSSPQAKAGYSDIIAECNVPVSALPLLAYCKVYVDMFLNGVVYNFSPLTYLLKCIHDNQDCVISGITHYSHSTGLLSVSGLYLIFDHILLPHRQNMYTEAWNSPNSPTSNPGTDLSSINPSGVLSPFEYASNPNYVELQGADSKGNITTFSKNSGIDTLSQNGLNLLRAFDKFVKRWNLAGTKAVQRIYASFGVKSDDFNSHFVHKLFEGSEKLTFNPVLSNSDTENSGIGSPLGAYAGFSASALNFNFDYKCSDFGFIIILNWIQIEPLFVRGMHPSVLRHSCLDFFTPEYDGKAIRAIPKCEISILKDKRSGSYPANEGDTNIFGFTNLYDDYRSLRNSIAGDFVLGGAKDFVFSRDMSVIRGSSGNLKPQTQDVQYYGYGPSDDMSNPFQMAYINGDRFYLQFDYDIEADRPVLTSSDSLDLNGSGDIELNKNGVLVN